ncbi:MAG: hypothetical protein HXX08_18175 [Chloroflexi bacterium]|uniref:Substrate-binding domain-containing protein n=1 Tax=Candidatus Chlorohelix allophototropha TaxID=3003348 RepID=A0A8T7M6T6_9CHLR|nr:hypothetical protein [Chloroflexota bacterium]WJW69689.1 substrate-binding domain-containing protein [Chloroflexota bacterium L227-S17]
MFSRRTLQKLTLVLFLFLPIFLLAGCSLDRKESETRWFVVAVDQSLEQDGLITKLIPTFEKENNVKVKLLPVDTSEAIRYAKAGGVDVLLVSGGDELLKFAGEAPPVKPFSGIPDPTPTAAPQPTPTPTALPFEMPFAERKQVLWSQLVMIAPANDPAGIALQPNVAKGLQRIADLNALYFVAGREPGLISQVENLWKLMGKYDIPSRGKGYKVEDVGMTELLRIAENAHGYAIIPLNVYLNNRQEGKSKIIFDKDYALYLGYEATIRNYISIPGQNINLSRKFVDFLQSDSTQNIITDYTNDNGQTHPYRPYWFPVYIPR